MTRAAATEARSEVQRALAEVRRTRSRRWTLMEICGGQTHAIVRSGLDTLLADDVALVHGPGCPVCVTPVSVIDDAIALAIGGGATLCSFGAMRRGPGTTADLLSARAAGADVRVVWSPLDALALAEREPGRAVVFLAVGFETTAPSTAFAVREAARRGVGNFSILCAHVRVPPAIDALLADPACRVDGILAAGHVCAIMGTEEYEPLARARRVPVVVAGFTALELLRAIVRAVRQLEHGRAEVENAYEDAVRTSGNPTAQAAVHEVFEPATRAWRGLGEIPDGALALRRRYAAYDAAVRFQLAASVATDDVRCIAGRVLRGAARPDACPELGRACTPDHPLGAPMVSSEGACAAYHRYRSGPT